MNIEDLAFRSVGWLDGSGRYSEVVLSSRIRLARNIKSMPFVHRSDDTQLFEIMNWALSSICQSKYLKNALFFNLFTLDEIDRQLLVERRLLSPGLVKKGRQSGIIVGKDEVLSVMINEEDHLRLQVILSGFQLRKAWELINALDDEFSRHVDYAFSKKFGYLTASLTNIGTGLRASVLIHLPALVLTGKVEDILKEIRQQGIKTTSFYGDGSEVVGNLFQISNQITLGKSEEDLVAMLEKIVEYIVNKENESRQRLIIEAKSQIEDKVWRAYGILENARLLTIHEFMNLSSATRLGLDMGFISYPEAKTFNDLMVTTQPSHLQRLIGRSLDSSERDILRANLVRKRFRSPQNRDTDSERDRGEIFPPEWVV